MFDVICGSQLFGEVSLEVPEHDEGAEKQKNRDAEDGEISPYVPVDRVVGHNLDREMVRRYRRRTR